MSELLLEIFCEEIPARMQGRAADDLRRLVLDGLTDEELAYEHADAYATPRRLALMVSGIPARQSDTREERKGPRVGAPEKALQGFLRGAGIESIDQCETRSDKKGEFYVAITERKGRAAQDVLADILPGIIRKFPWPKSMRWGSGDLRWVRPLHSILCVFGPSQDGSRIVDFEIDGIKSGDTTFGHRFMAPGSIKARHFIDYEKGLAKAFVMLDPKERRTRIWDGAKELAAAQELELVDDERLLEEVAGLVEWPVPLLGTFDEDFLELPEEVLESSMRKHQKYFSLRNPKTGNTSNHFIVVSNLIADDGGKQIIAGNERVLRARLSDARFFWDQDRKMSLEDRLDGLSRVTFHEKIGNLGDKSNRLSLLAADVAQHLGASQPIAELARQAGKLAKADLISDMVGEFPELQGVMGRYYAEGHNEDANVSLAIGQHYKPQGPNDEIPTNKVAVAVAIADKLDTLIGFFGINEKPTGSRDPFGLRRAALGIIRIILENKLRLSLSVIFEKAVFHYAAEDSGIDWSVSNTDLLAFFADRLKVYLRDKGARHDLIDAVFALEGQDDLLMIVRRVEALGAFLDSEDGANLLAGVKRASNIIRIEEKKDKRSYDGAPDPALFTQDEERALFDRIAEARAEADAAVKREDFEGAMAAMARLRSPVDEFFDHVTVNADEPQVRENRLKILSDIRAATRSVADFSKIAG